MECIVCKQVFRDNFNLNRHLKTHVKTNVTHKPRLCPLCKQEFKVFHEHLSDIHNVTLQKSIIVFSSIKEFFAWKEQMEQETSSRFVKHSGSSRRKDGSVYTYYYCHRGGDYVPKGRNGTCKKTAGSNKIQANCPASIKVTEGADGKVSVCFINTHVGHSCDVARMTLTVSEREKLAEQIRMKVPLDDILQGIRNSVKRDNMQRIHLTTKNDLRNLIVQYGLHSDTPDIPDTESIDKWVHFMKEHGNIICLYKSQGIYDTNYPYLEENDFCLIFANEEQLNTLKMFGNDILCVDGIYGEPEYDFHLFTIFVLDEMRTGFPCAFMFSNRSDSVIMNLFFKTVIESIEGPLSPRYFICDMDETFFNDWASHFSLNDVKQLYTAWHVDKVWQQNLTKIKSEEIKVEVYKKIKLLMFEQDKSTFHLMSEVLIKELSDNDMTQSFAKHFERFIHEPSKWAYCYQLEAGINIDVAVEVLHKNLKHAYQAGKRGKKLIKSIHALQKYLRDHAFLRSSEHCKGSMRKKLTSLRKRHQSSLELSVDSVHTLGEDSWTVFCGTETYNVLLCKKECNCNLRCEECSTCLHSFLCTCTDSSVLWNMCKHIHLVCRAISVQVLEIYQEYPTDQTSDSEQFANIIVIQLTTDAEVEDLEQGKKDVLLEIANVVNEEVKSEKGLEALKQLISPLKEVIRGAEEVGGHSSFVTIEEDNEPPFKKMCSQSGE